MTQNITVNKLSVPTYRKLHVNDTTISNYICDTYISPAISGELSIKKKHKCKILAGGLGEVFDKTLSDNFSECDTVIIPENYSSETINNLKLNYEEEHGFVTNLYFMAEKNSKSSFVITLSGVHDISFFATVKLNIEAQNNSAISIYVASLLPGNIRLAIDYAVEAGDDAKVSVDMVSLGAKNAYIGAKANLTGSNSSFDTRLAYHLHEGQTLDANYISRHIGKSSRCLMESTGTLENLSKKTMRSTLDFVAGSKKSTGAEKEDVLLLGNTPINQSVPLILCGEEDIEGNHGATIGNINDAALFYLQSRGINKENAMKLMASTKITYVSNRFPNDEIRKEIESYEGL